MISETNCRVLYGQEVAATATFHEGAEYGTYCVVLRSDNSIVTECFFQPVSWHTATVHTFSLPEKVELPEAYIGFANEWYGTFSHFFTELVPKLYMYSQSGRDCPLLIPPAHQPLWNTIDAYGISRDRVVEMRRGVEYQLGTAHYTGYPGCGIPDCRSEQIAAYRELRQRLHVPSQEPAESLYLSRRDVRDGDNANAMNAEFRYVANEDEVLSRLPGYKLVGVGNLSLAEKAYLFKDTERVVAVIGGGMYNLVLAPRLKRLLVLTNRRHRVTAAYINGILRETVDNLEISTIYGEYVSGRPIEECDNEPFNMSLEQITP